MPSRKDAYVLHHAAEKRRGSSVRRHNRGAASERHCRGRRSGCPTGSGSTSNTSSSGAGDRLVAQGGNQRRLVDNGAARRVDQIRAGGFIRPSSRGTDEAARALRQLLRGSDRKSARRNRSSLADVFDSGFPAFLRRDILAPGDRCPFRKPRPISAMRVPKFAKAEEPEREAFEIEPDRCLPVAPALRRAFS